MQVQAQARSTSLVLRRHCRVSPQRRVIGFPVRSLVGRWFARGRTPIDLGAAAHPVIGATPEGGASTLGVGERTRVPRGTGSFGASSLALRLRPWPGADVFPPESGGRSSEQRRTASFSRGEPAGDACSGLGRHSRGDSSPEPSERPRGSDLGAVSPRTGWQRPSTEPQGGPEGCLAGGAHRSGVPRARHAAGTR